MASMASRTNAAPRKQWRLRLQPEWRTGSAAEPRWMASQPCVMYGSRPATVAVRWYSVTGPPTQAWMDVSSPTAAGDFIWTVTAWSMSWWPEA